MQFRVRTTLNYITEIEFFCATHGLDSPVSYRDKMIGEVKMAEIDDSYINYLLTDHQEVYAEFMELIMSFL